MDSISELMNLRFDAIQEAAEDGVPIFTFHLVFRKTNDDPTRGRNIY